MADMADESVHIVPMEQNIDYYITNLFDRLEAMRKSTHSTPYVLSSNIYSKHNMKAEIRSLEFWRSIIGECLASFFYVFIVCGAAAGAGIGASVSSVLMTAALASGLAMATLTQCFMHISGAHINPAVTLALGVIRKISPLRTAMYITAQCGGGIAGASLLYGVTAPGYQGNLQAAVSHNASLAAWERFGMELILSFVVVFAYLVSTDSCKRVLGNAATTIGVAYSACSFVSMPYLNPARSLGPSFVLNKWDNQWVYWFGPLVGGILSGVVYEYVFNSRRPSIFSKSSASNESSSLGSEDGVNYDIDHEKINMTPKYSGSFARTQQNTNAQSLDNDTNFCHNLYTVPPVSKFERPEPLYSGTRSMHCRSPTLNRSHLHRSQSVYAKSNTALNREGIPRAGPLVPAQSLYPMLNSSQQAQFSHLQNQNVQNQLQQRSDNMHGIRGTTRQQQPQQKQLNQVQQQQQDSSQRLTHFFADNRHNKTSTNGIMSLEKRPESVYGTTVMVNRGLSAQSDDSSYGSYPNSTITTPVHNSNGERVLMYGPHPTHNNDIRGAATNIRMDSEHNISPTVPSPHLHPSGSVTFSSNQRSLTQQRSQQHQQMNIQQQQQHYGMLPTCQN